MFARNVARFASRALRPAAVVAARPLSTAAVSAARSKTLMPVIATVGASALFMYNLSSASAKAVDYDAVRKAIRDILESEEDYDDGSLGPVFVRLAWHASGTFDVFSGTGGSNGATMRFAPECNHGANAGLGEARKRLETIKQQFPGISYADLWTLAGAVAIEEMGGPKINWRPGRTDASSGKACPPDGRLPDAARNADHIRAVFYRMGFSDREMVALIGAHAVGRCHTDRSGFDGPWTFSPVTFSNEYFRLLVEEKWVPRQWNGPAQYKDATTGTLMMLPTDVELVRDPEFRKYTEMYAKDEALFFKDFAAAFQKLCERGVFDEERSGGFFCRIC